MKGSLASLLNNAMLASAKNNRKGMGVVIWGAIGTLGTSFNEQWTAAERALWTIGNVPTDLRSVVVGLLLSDGWLQIPQRGVNARLGFKQSMIHFPYFMFV